MDTELDQQTIQKFLFRVIEIEERPAFLKKGQDSARKDEINKALDKALDEFCN